MYARENARRRFLRALGALGVGAALPARAQLKANPRFAAFPFSLGVASGYPGPAGLTLWTRLAPVPDAPGGGMAPEIVPVAWEVARDEAMNDIAASGTAYATPEWAHSLHVEAIGLQPNRPYWYRFRAGDAQSATGLARTLPLPANRPARLRFAFASCQQYEQGYYGAYRHMAADQPDLVLHLGDYIYEGSWGRDHVRKHNTPEAVTLDDYRARYALYRSDPDLQAAHSACPWLVTWDDHEVSNDYAPERSENLDVPEWFLARRAAAYKAWYEHMPVPRRMLPIGPHARIYTRLSYANLASFFVVDNRQYRTPQACPRPGRGGGSTVEVAQCPDLVDPKRTLLGMQQEQWLEAGLGASRQRWNVIAQQTLMAQLNRAEGAGKSFWTDGWDGYPVARRRLLDFLASSKASNPVVIGGDVHAFYVSELKADFDDPNSPVVASEFVGTSISSQHGGREWLDKRRLANPHILLAESRYRGYTRVEVTSRRMQVDLRAVEDVQRRETPCRTLASFVVEDGKPGPLRA
ncbi:MAG TPA: alkaline phosphatase D family protein [Burkholderiales bacterium]|nr:alkaline phosphatase D family protein [Burkholderiales bacterium]